MSDLQSDIAVTNKRITGELSYIDEGALVDAWGAGNFIALKFTKTDDSVTSIKVGLDPSSREGGTLVELDEDMNGAFKVTNKDAQRFVVEQTTADGKKEREYYNLSGLTCEAAPADDADDDNPVVG